MPEAPAVTNTRCVMLSPRLLLIIDTQGFAMPSRIGRLSDAPASSLLQPNYCGGDTYTPPDFGDPADHHLFGRSLVRDEENNRRSDTREARCAGEVEH